MTPPGEISVGSFADLFERARQALAEQGSAEPTLGSAAPEGESGASSRVVAHLRIDEASRVWVRFCDARTGETVAEVRPQLVAAAAARLQTAMR